MKETGVVDGTRDNCAEAFRQRQCVLVFPGGARESFKGREERYELIWGERLGFARMALRHQVTIVPFAAIGADDAFRLAMDRTELKQSRLGAMLGKLGIKDDYLVPLPSNVLPAPRRLYFRFLPPVRTSTLAHLPEDEAAVEVRDQTRAAVARGIEALRRIRRSDPRDGFGPMEHWLAGL
jgi:1-acyl-sn-glycerol-3-phosphate acyltransferase